MCVRTEFASILPLSTCLSSSYLFVRPTTQQRNKEKKSFFPLENARLRASSLPITRIVFFWISFVSYAQHFILGSIVADRDPHLFGRFSLSFLWSDFDHVFRSVACIETTAEYAAPSAVWRAARQPIVSFISWATTFPLPAARALVVVAFCNTPFFVARVCTSSAKLLL